MVAHVVRRQMDPALHQQPSTPPRNYSERIRESDRIHVLGRNFRA